MYVQALESRTSPMNSKQEEFFIKRSLELKIYDSLESARNALKGIKGRLAIKMESLNREIGFSKSSSPKLKASDSDGPTKSTIGFSNDPNGSQPASNNDVVKEPGKVGFTFPTASGNAPQPANPNGSFLDSLSPAKIESTLKSASAAERGGGPGGVAKQVASLLIAITVGTGEAIAQEVSDQGHSKVQGSANRTKEMMEIALGERLGSAAYDHVIKPAYEAAIGSKSMTVGTK